MRTFWDPFASAWVLNMWQYIAGSSEMLPPGPRSLRVSLHTSYQEPRPLTLRVLLFGNIFRSFKVLRPSFFVHPFLPSTPRVLVQRFVNVNCCPSFSIATFTLIDSIENSTLNTFRSFKPLQECRIYQSGAQLN
jgi:hypothetical protein